MYYEYGQIDREPEWWAHHYEDMEDDVDPYSQDPVLIIPWYTIPPSDHEMGSLKD